MGGVIKLLKVAKIATVVFLITGYLATSMPLLFGIINFAIIMPNIIFLAGIVYLILREIKELKKNKFFMLVDKIMITIFSIGVIIMLSISLVMAFGFNKYSGGNIDVVIVPGAKVNGDYPSRMLKGRLDQALGLLNDMPNAVCVVTGGKGDDEQYTEASVMKKYLVENGIKDKRVYVEDSSVNTSENFVNAKTIIEQNNLGVDLTVTTDYYHSYRCLWYAKQAGINANASPNKTQNELITSYWIREIFGVIKAWMHL